MGRIQKRLMVAFVSDFFNLLSVKFHPIGIIFAKHLVQGRNSEAWVRLNEPFVNQLLLYRLEELIKAKNIENELTIQQFSRLLSNDPEKLGSWVKNKVISTVR